MNIFEKITKESLGRLDKMSKKEVEETAMKRFSVSEEFIRGTQLVDISKERADQISSILATVLADSGLLDKEPKSVELAIKLRATADIIYSAGFADGFFEQLPKIMVDMRTPDSPKPLDSAAKSE